MRSSVSGLEGQAFERQDDISMIPKHTSAGSVSTQGVNQLLPNKIGINNYRLMAQTSGRTDLKQVYRCTGRSQFSSDNTS